MSLISSKKIDTNRFELEIEVSAEKFNQAVEKSFKKNVKKISIPGFRKGKAPRSFIEKYYGENVFYEDAIDMVYPEAVEEAVKEAKLEIVNDKVDFDVIKIGKEGFIFKVALTTKPEIEISEYKNLGIKKENTQLNSEELEKALESSREKAGRLISVEDRAAKLGDVTIIDFEGFVDEKPFEGGKAEKFSLKLGSSQFIPGFEDQIVGHAAGEEFEVNVTFPDSYGEITLAGKPAIFKIKLHEIKEMELPVLDDEFAKDISEFETLEEYKKDLEKKLLAQKEEKVQTEFVNKILDKLAENSKVEIPQAMIENKIDENLREFDYKLRSQGMDLDTYAKYAGIKMEEFRNQFAEQSKKQVTISLALEKIAKLENIKVSEQEIEAKYQELAESYKMEVEKIKGLIKAEDLQRDIESENAVAFLCENAD